MFRIFLVVAVWALFAAPAMSQISQQQQKQIQKRESSDEAASQVQQGGLKHDRKISQRIRNANNRMRTHRYRTERYGQ